MQSPPEATAHEPGETRQGSRSAFADRARLILDVSRVLEAVLVFIVVFVTVSWILIAVVHVGDRAFVFWPEASRMALADSARSGMLYPPLYEDGLYGGTRYMPIPILLHAAASVFTGELIASGKVVTYLSFGVLLRVIWVATKRSGASVRRAAVLGAGLVATDVGARASLGISHDPLPIALQLGALLLVEQPTRRSVVGAGLLTSIAFLSKLSALWGAAAVALWLLWRHRQLLFPFVAMWVATVGLGVLSVQLATDGRFGDNLFGLATSGIGSGTAMAHMLRELVTLIPAAPAGILIPLAGIGMVSEIRAGRATVFHVGLIFSVVILLVELADIGGSHNHALDGMVLSAIVIAGLWKRWDRQIGRSAIIILVVLMSVLASFPLGLGRVAWDTIDSALTRTPDPRYELMPLENGITSSDRILSEDASIPLLLGRDPIILDAFMLARIAERHPEWRQALVDRIVRREFDWIVLLTPLDDAPPGWYTDIHLGAEISEAIATHYIFVGHRGRFAVYAPS